MAKFKLLLVDANVVIYLHELGAWDAVIDKCQVSISSSVLGESDFHSEDEFGTKTYIDLTGAIKAGKVVVFDIDLSDVTDFRNQFDADYKGDLDPGESDLLVHLFKQNDPTALVCSADAIVYKVLGNRNKGEQAISLERLLQMIGLGRKVDARFSEATKNSLVKKGGADMVQGKGWIG